MDTVQLLIDVYRRVREAVHAAVDGLDADQLAHRLDADANSIGWLVWHLTRVQDDHVAGVARTEQVWITDGFAERFDLPFDRAAIGYGQSSSEVAAVRVAAPELLTDYHDAVHARTVDYLGGLSDADLDTVVDENWDPPVTLGTRLVSVVVDDLEHAGQATFVRGIAERAAGTRAE